MIKSQTIYTDDAMSRPLSEPLSERHERVDAWSEPLGFVVGGMAHAARQVDRDGILAEQYFTAANALIDATAQGHVADYQVANAALFLYRHTFELLLKAGLPPAVRNAQRTHNLAALGQTYVQHRSSEGVKVPRWALRRLEELAALDPDSQAFRYGSSGIASKSDELHVGLFHLKASMLALYSALVEQNWSVRMARGDSP